MSWSVCATVMETREVTLNFVAHHLLLGADRIFLFFDNPQDPSLHDAARDPRVRAIACDTAYWSQFRAGRSDRLYRRQKTNAQWAYGETETDWLIHIDADEMIEADRPIADILAQAPDEEPVIRLRPFEMMETPRSLVPAPHRHAFRGQLPSSPQGRRIGSSAYGDLSTSMKGGLISHAEGKFFVRAGRDDVSMTIHAPFINGERARATASPDMRLLHLHGGDRDDWIAKSARRATEGAYKDDVNRLMRREGTPSLGERLTEIMASDGVEGLNRAYDNLCRYDAKKLKLRRVDALHFADLWLDEERAAVFEPGGRVRAAERDAHTGALRLTLHENDCLFPVEPSRSPAEAAFTANLLPPIPTGTLGPHVSGQRIKFVDLGAGLGRTTLFVARQSSPDSEIVAVEPDVEQAQRLRATCALNGLHHVIVLDDPSQLVPYGSNLFVKTLVRLAGDYAERSEEGTDSAHRARVAETLHSDEDGTLIFIAGPESTVVPFAQAGRAAS